MKVRSDMLAYMRKPERATHDMKLFDRHAADVANIETVSHRKAWWPRHLDEFDINVYNKKLLQCVLLCKVALTGTCRSRVERSRYDTPARIFCM